MADKEFGRVCQKCKKKGGDTFARVYYKPIDGKWVRLCGVCWDAVEHNAHLTCGSVRLSKHFSNLQVGCAIWHFPRHTQVTQTVVPPLAGRKVFQMGAFLTCPYCKYDTHVGHWEWSELVCLNCKKMVKQEHWLIAIGRAAQLRLHLTAVGASHRK